MVVLTTATALAIGASGLYLWWIAVRCVTMNKKSAFAFKFIPLLFGGINIVIGLKGLGIL
jgi:hypothetical protein